MLMVETLLFLMLRLFCFEEFSTHDLVQCSKRKLQSYAFLDQGLCIKNILQDNQIFKDHMC